MKVIEADHGTHFTGDAVVSELKSLGIAMCFGTTGHHEAQGTCDNRIRQVRDWIRKLHKVGKGAQRDEHLYELVVQMREQCLARLDGLSPYAVVYGREMLKMPIFLI